MTENGFQRMGAVASWLRKKWFLAGLFAAIGLGLAFPGLGDVLNPGGSLTRAITIILFLIVGLTLPAESIRQGLSSVRLQVFIQVFIFAVVPAYFAATTRFIFAHIDGPLLVGVYALAVLPTTVSTCIVFTQTAGGNTVAALFNSTVANMAGVIISPLLLGMFLKSAGRPLPADEVASVLLTLASLILVPVGAGQLIRRWRSAVQRLQGQFSELSSALILVIVFITFSSTAANPDFSAALPRLGVPMAYMAFSHVVLVGLAYLGARLLRFELPDQITAVFTAPQKTMAMGVPLLTVYFASDPAIMGFALMPLLMYHPWQLLIGGLLRSHFRQRVAARAC